VVVRGIRQRALGAVNIVCAIGALAVACAALVAGYTLASAAEDAPSDPSTSQATCRYGPTHRMSQVREAAIREASALVASRQWPGIYWTLNDSHNAPIVFAFDQQGEARGTFRVGNATNVDWEALQLGPDGNGGDALYVGDIGDNDYLRRESIIYRVPEPAPVSAGGRLAGETAPATAFRFVFPVRQHNVEAMLVHPKTGEVLLISREINGFSLIYRLPLPLDGEGVMMAELVDVVDVKKLDPASGLVTDATVSSDGRHVALRTYASVLVYDVPTGAPLASIWDQQPRVYRLQDGLKGEGVTYRLGSEDLLSIGEEKPTSLYETAWQC
jgi:hypothetical protein